MSGAKILEKTCFLTIGTNGQSNWPSLNIPRITKNKPALGPNEVCIKIEIALPETLFTRPSIEARIAVPEDSVIPPVVSMDVIDNIQEIAAQQGLQLTISVPEELQ